MSTDAPFVSGLLPGHVPAPARARPHRDDRLLYNLALDRPANRALARCVYLFGSGRLPDALLLALSSADGPAPRWPAPRKRIPLEIVEDAHPA